MNVPACDPNFVFLSNRKMLKWGNSSEGSPPQGLSEARRGKFLFCCQEFEPPRGRPIGGGGGIAVLVIEVRIQVDALMCGLIGIFDFATHHI
jgi:hypothetical protein